MCQACRRKADQARGTRQQRGYDASYDRQRRAGAHALGQGAVLTCWRCGHVVTRPLRRRPHSHPRTRAPTPMQPREHSRRLLPYLTCDVRGWGGTPNTRSTGTAGEGSPGSVRFSGSPYLTKRISRFAAQGRNRPPLSAMPGRGRKSWPEVELVRGLDPRRIRWLSVVRARMTPLGGLSCRARDARMPHRVGRLRLRPTERPSSGWRCGRSRRR
jgi:hypothetical protein